MIRNPFGAAGASEPGWAWKYTQWTPSLTYTSSYNLQTYEQSTSGVVTGIDYTTPDSDNWGKLCLVSCQFCKDSVTETSILNDLKSYTYLKVGESVALWSVCVIKAIEYYSYNSYVYQTQTYYGGYTKTGSSSFGLVRWAAGGPTWYESRSAYQSTRYVGFNRAVSPSTVYIYTTDAKSITTHFYTYSSAS